MLRFLGELSVFLGLFGVLCLITGPSTLLHKTNGTAFQVRKTKEVKAAADGKYTKISTTCQIPELQAPTKKVQPTFLATYPGSGTKLQWELVEALTGIVTTDDVFSNGHHNVVGIKTHFPCPAGREFPGAESVMRAIIFVRHPMDTLPAYYDIIYASENDKPYDNPDRAPLEDWIEWRDLAFARELEVWRKHFVYWMERYSSLNRFLVQYEKLVHRAYGPDIVIHMAEFLSRGMGASVPAEEDIPCIWQKITDKVLSKDSSKRMLRRRLQQMISQTSNGIPLMPGPQLLGPNQGQQSYYGQNQVPAEQLNPNQIANNQMGPEQIQMNPQMLLQSQQLPLLQQDNRMYQQVMLPTNPNSRPLSDTNGLPSLDGISLATDANSIPIPNEHGLLTLALTEQSMASGNVQPSPLQSFSGEWEAETGPSSDATSLVDSQMPKADEDAGSDEEKAAGKMKQTQDGETDDIKVAVPTRTIPVADDYRPYTEAQRKEIVIVLAQLLEKYRDDHSITPILVEYIDQVERRHQEQNRGSHI